MTKLMNQKELLALTAEGKDAWNEWADANPDADVDFSGVTFDSDMSFRGFRFPQMTSFSKATFSGSADFNKATFTGIADFREATFSDSAIFSKATFTGDAVFNEATFSSAFFSQATFSRSAGFLMATFTGIAKFRESTFTGIADFRESTFTRIAYFITATFSSAFFSQATFTGIADFRWATFTGIADFVGIEIKVRVDFESAEFYQFPDFHAAKNSELIALGAVRFTLPKPANRWERLLYWTTGIRGSDRSTMLRIRQIRGIVAKAHAIDSERDLTILERNAQVGTAWEDWYWMSSLTDENDVDETEVVPALLERDAQIGAIPELWQDSKPLRQWLANFFATLFDTVLLIAYRWSSKYGRSVVVPVLWLVGMFFSYRWFYGYLYDKVSGNYQGPTRLSDSLLDFTITSMVPFGSNVRPTYQIAVNDLFRPIEPMLTGSQVLTEGRVPALFQLVSLSQGVLTLTFVFLIGLALRNFFRMK